MQRNLIIAAGALLVVLVLGAAFYVAFLANGDEVALAQLDRAVRAYDGSYDSADYDPVTDRLIVEGLVLHDVQLDPEAEPLDLVEVSHLDVTGLARLTLQEALGGGRRQDVLSTLEAMGIVLTEDDQAISIARLAMRDVSLDVTGQPDFDAAAPGVTRAQVAAQLALILHAGEITVTEFQSPQEGPTGMEVGVLRIEDMEGGRVASISAERVSLWDEGQIGTVGDTLRLRAGGLSLENIDARVPLQRMAAGEAVTFNRQSNVPTYSRFGADDLVIERERGEPLTVGGLSVENTAYVGPMAADTSVSLTALRLPLNGEFVDEQESAALRELGYDNLVFNFRYAAAFDVAGQAFDLTDMAVGIDDLGELQMALLVGDVPFTEDMIDRTAESLADEGFIAALLEYATLQSGTVSFTDDGLFARVVEQNAAKAGQSPEEYLQTAIAELQAQREEVASSEVAVEAVDALIAFFEDPQTISVSFAPDTPVPLHQLVIATQINPLILIELLNLQIATSD
jgi:hypothetical protein